MGWLVRQVERFLRHDGAGWKWTGIAPDTEQKGTN